MKRLLLLALLLPLCLSCKKTPPPGPDPDPGTSDYINVDRNVSFLRLGSLQTLDVDTNIESIECTVPASIDWCDADYLNGVLTISVSTNDAFAPRSTAVYLKGGKIEKMVAVNQLGRSSTTGELQDDVKVPVASATASSYQGGTNIDKSIDGNMSTFYHSQWNRPVTPSTPVTLTYNFENAERIDYLIYNPRGDGNSNGNFKEFDIYVETAGQPTRTLYGSYDFGGSAAAAIVSFSPALQNPLKIEFVVKTGAGDSSGTYANCAEMQFFKKGEAGFDPSAIFTDETCSELKSGVDRSDIDEIPNEFYKELAIEIFEGTYNLEFRVQDYKSWQHPDVMAAANKTSTYSLRDNPTGIYVRRGEDLVVMAGDLHGQRPALFVQDPNRMIQGSSYPLATGLNKFEVSNDGLIYIMYHTPTGTEPSVRLNIVTGQVNGYFDSAKHTGDQWAELLAKATFERFDLVGQYTHLIFDTNKFRQYTPDGLALVNKYDDMIRLEQDFMGLFKYNREFRNRMLFLVMSGSSYMHASSYYTGYDVGTQEDILTLSRFSTAPWGPAHEAGHVNQTRPGLRWKGMTEVTNNIHSLYVQTEWGNVSRLVADGRYAKGFREMLDADLAHNAHEDVFCKLIPFWQLKLYIHDVLGNTDFYKDVYEAIRVNPNPRTDGDCQMEFVKIACDVAQLDLTDFFEAWGFFKPISITIDDYGTGGFTVTQAMADAAKAYIASKGYPEPQHNFERITDDTLDDYR